MRLQIGGRFPVDDGLDFDIVQTTHTQPLVPEPVEPVEPAEPVEPVEPAEPNSALHRATARARRRPTDCSATPVAAPISRYESPWARSESSRRSRAGKVCSAASARRRSGG